MKSEPPEGSKIQVERTMHSISYTWENGNDIVRHLIGVFLLLFFCGWTFAGFFLFKEMMSESIPENWKLSLTAWLVGWLTAEASLLAMLYFTLKRPKPAKLTLSDSVIRYDTGTRPIGFDIFENAKGFFHILRRFRKQVYEIEASQLINLKLERVGEKQRLYFNYSGEIVEIGESLSEPEREWLYEILTENV